MNPGNDSVNKRVADELLGCPANVAKWTLRRTYTTKGRRCVGDQALCLWPMSGEAALMRRPSSSS